MFKISGEVIVNALLDSNVDINIMCGKTIMGRYQSKIKDLKDFLESERPNLAVQGTNYTIVDCIWDAEKFCCDIIVE